MLGTQYRSMVSNEDRKKVRKKKRAAKVGRPVAKAGDPGGREKILDSARSLLRERGLSQPTLREIAERANVDPALIHYHFGSKRDLYEEIAITVYEGVWKQVEEAGSGNYPSPADRARAVVRAFVRAVSHDSYAPSLVALLEGQYGEVPERLSAVQWQLFALSDEVFAAPSTARGPATDNPVFIATAVGGVTGYFFMAAPYFTELGSRVAISSEIVEAWAEFVADLHIRGLGIPEQS
jgi:AcrR family transcriptional regulator